MLLKDVTISQKLPIRVIETSENLVQKHILTDVDLEVFETYQKCNRNRNVISLLVATFGIYIFLEEEK